VGCPIGRETVGKTPWSCSANRKTPTGQCATFQTVSEGGYGANPPLMQVKTPLQGKFFTPWCRGHNWADSAATKARAHQAARCSEKTAGQRENLAIEAQLETRHAGAVLGVDAAEIE